jgi:putative GTP pyrophosphokinase
MNGSVGNALSSTRVDKLGDLLRGGGVSAEALIELDKYRRSFGSAYQKVIGLTQQAVRLPATGRPSKSTSAILEKLRRESSRLSQMQDIAGCRIIVDDIPRQNSVVDTLNAYLGAPRIVDRRANPSHGYRAVHLIANITGRFVEVQVRTLPQHLWAEISEKLADTIDSSLKYGHGDEGALRFLRSLSDGIKKLEDEEDSRDKALWTISGLSRDQKKRYRKDLRVLESNYVERRASILRVLTPSVTIVVRSSDPSPEGARGAQP